MTEKKKTTFCKVKKAISPIFILLLILVFALKLSGDVRDDVSDGIRVAALIVIPTAMPFMVISDLYRCYGNPSDLPFITRIFSFLFGISPVGVTAFICGNLSGFPIGAKASAELYADGSISRSEAEKLCAFSNNPSIPFVIFAVGESLFNKRSIGVFLLLVLYISCFICMVIFGGKERNVSVSSPHTRDNFRFIDSVRNAGNASVGVASFIIIFFAAVGIVEEFVKNKYLFTFFVSILEVTSAVSYAASVEIPLRIRLAVCSFALSFGGLSVLMQSGLFTNSAGLSLRRYSVIKLSQGVIGFGVSYLLFPILFK